MKKSAKEKLPSKESKVKERVIPVSKTGIKPSVSQMVSKYEEQLFKRLQTQVVKVVRANSLLSGNYAATRLRTGLLCVDLMLGGGLRPGNWYTNFGPEQSGKSTLAVRATAAAYLAKVQMNHYWDYEGSAGSDMEYLQRQFKAAGIKEDIDSLIGDVEDKKPITYWGEDILETFFDTNAAILRRMPDRQCIDGQWYYVFDDDKYGKEMTDGNYDKKIKSKFGRLAIQSDNANALGGLLVVDSYPAMNPRAADADDPKAGMALQARAFSENIRRIRGKLRPKGVTIVGVNQLRLRPGFTMGDPAYESGGEALKFYSDGRIRCSKISSQWGPPQALQTEEAIGGGTDTYQHMKYILKKNKVGGLNNVEIYQRVWISDKNGNAQGFDAVGDLYNYLEMTGQIKGKRNKFTLEGPGIKSTKSMNFMTFKTMILGNPDQREKIQRDCGLIGKKDKAANLKQLCYKQMSTGQAAALVKQNANKREKES